MEQNGKSGVYAVVSKTLNKGYIGMSKDLMRRWLSHYVSMLDGQHNASLVQAAHDQYGIDDFEFVVLEYVPYEPGSTKLLLAERKWKLKTDANRLLNNLGDRVMNTSLQNGKTKQHTKLSEQRKEYQDWKKTLVWLN
jgi:group I intron endonuclease